MAESGPISGVIDSARQIGRHFAVAVGVPSLVATVVPLVLLFAGAPDAAPTANAALRSVRGIGIAEAGLLFVAVVALGLVMHPLQFALTQMLEGYWGCSVPAQRAMVRSSQVHLERALSLVEVSTEAGWLVSEADDTLAAARAELNALQLDPAWSEEADRALRHAVGVKIKASIPARVRYQEADTALRRYPADLKEVMPTRLGNVLRRSERLAGEPYGLDAISVTGLLTQVADDTLRDYHDDARTDLDLAIQMVLVWGWCSLSGLALLWPHGLWLLLPAGLAALTYVSYRGAVAAADAYGEALVVLVALGRPNLYDALRLPLPTDTDSECAVNELVSRQLAGERVSMRYRRGRSQDSRLPRLQAGSDG